MNSLEVKKYPDSCLRIKTRPVEDFDKDLSETVAAMADLMYVSQGIGLAATQVGLGLSILVMDPGDGLAVLANPRITERSSKKTRLEEGCLSVPGITVSVNRPEEVKVRYQDERGEFFLKTFTGLAAKVVQHEMDHLAGTLIIDHMDPVSRFFVSRKLRKNGFKTEKRTCEVVCNAGKRHSDRT